MHGNVYEWTQDCYVASYKNAPSDGSAVYTNDDCLRVLRGGSWSNNPQDLRAANRFRLTPVNRSNDVGFRLSRTLTP